MVKSDWQNDNQPVDLWHQQTGLLLIDLQNRVSSHHSMDHSNKMQVEHVRQVDLAWKGWQLGMWDDHLH